MRSSKKYLFFIIFFLSLFKFFFITPAAVTYNFSGGRFGDNLIAYLHAKWLSYKFKIPLVYKPFKYSEYLALDTLESKTPPSPIEQVVVLRKNNLIIDPQENILYLIPYFSEFSYEFKSHRNNHWIYFPLDWNNHEFHQIMQKYISPVKEIIFSLPSDKTCIALHVRRGGGYDGVNAPYTDPLKFPPDSFYIKMVQSLIETLDDNHFYIYIFTDDPNPSAIAYHYSKELENKFGSTKEIIFDFHQNNYHDENVIEDFFFLTKFPYMIRPQSNYSFIAARLSKPKIEIAPVEHVIINGRPEITQVELFKEGFLCDQSLLFSPA